MRGMVAKDSDEDLIVLFRFQARSLLATIEMLR